MAKEVVEVYVAEHCQSCQEIKQMLEAGQFSLSHGDSIDLIDIETEEGYQKMQTNPNLDAVPSAFYKGQKCKINRDEESIYIECPNSGS